jgi:hypothetical protein
MAPTQFNSPIHLSPKKPQKKKKKKEEKNPKPYFLN